MMTNQKNPSPLCIAKIPTVNKALSFDFLRLTDTSQRRSGSSPGSIGTSLKAEILLPVNCLTPYDRLHASS